MTSLHEALAALNKAVTTANEANAKVVMIAQTAQTANAIVEARVKAIEAILGAPVEDAKVEKPVVAAPALALIERMQPYPHPIDVAKPGTIEQAMATTEPTAPAQ